MICFSNSHLEGKPRPVLELPQSAPLRQKRAQEIDFHDQDRSDGGLKMAPFFSWDGSNKINLWRPIYPDIAFLTSIYWGLGIGGQVVLLLPIKCPQCKSIICDNIS
jgi:hypothetical protein